jgi:hypothetical protein
MRVTLGPIDHDLVIDTERLGVGQDLMGNDVAPRLDGPE